MTLHRLVLLAALVPLAGGCEKSGPVETIPPEVLDPSLRPAETTDTATKTAIAKSRATEVGTFPAQVRPPVASDLQHYIDDLGTTGTLIAVIETSMGEIRCELFEEKTPITVANFIGLARGLKPYRDNSTGEVRAQPFYDGLTFHRVMPTFMIQGGDPRSDGTGGPGYKFDNEIHPLLRHSGPGTLSMANAGADTNGSQFFISEAARADWDDNYTVFGRCKNLSVVRDIARVEVDDKKKPLSPVAIERVSIIRGEL